MDRAAASAGLGAAERRLVLAVGRVGMVLEMPRQSLGDIDLHFATREIAEDADRKAAGLHPAPLDFHEELDVVAPSLMVSAHDLEGQTLSRRDFPRNMKHLPDVELLHATTGEQPSCRID